MRGVWLVVLVAGTGCGRIGFDVAIDGDARPGPDADLAVVCGAAYQPVAGLTSRYRLVTSNRVWATAEADCESDGGHLVAVDDASEDAWAFSQTAGWLGISDHLEEGTFRTVTGLTVSFEHWDISEPNNSTNNEDCVEMRADGLWNDSGCTVTREFVCECDGVPMPSPPVYCDTTSEQSCGECGTVCSTGFVCTQQACVDPS